MECSNAVLLILPNMTDGFIILLCDPAQFKSDFFFLANLSQALTEPHITSINLGSYLTIFETRTFFIT